MLIICGPSCAGKSTFGEVARSLGLCVVEGSVIVKEIFLTNQKISEDTISLCQRWYTQHGRNIFAKENHRRMVAQGLNLDKLVFVGCRTVEEIEYLKDIAPKSRVIGLYADARVRFARCEIRDRSDRAFTFEFFVRRDMRELDMGVASVMAYAIDRLIINNEESVTGFEQIAQKELRAFAGELDIEVGGPHDE